MTMHLRLPLLVAILVVATAMCGRVAICAEPPGFVVAGDGSDDNPGTEARPFASLRRARDAARTLREKGPVERVRVLVRGGRYQLTEPIVFEPADSGTTYAAWPGEKPVFSGGRKLPEFKPVGDGLWAVTIPEVANGKWKFEQLFVNGSRATRARTPNRQLMRTAGKASTVVDVPEKQRKKLDRTAFVALHQDIEPLLRMSPEELASVTLVAVHSWEVSRHHIASIDKETNLVRLTGPYFVSFFHFKPDEAYYLEGYRSALDAPGEWCLGGDGTLLYRPLPGQDINKTEAVAATIDQFVAFEGKPGDSNRIENITLSGLTFQHAQYVLPRESCSNNQAASKIPAVVMVDHARNIVLDDCRIEHIGTYGIWFRDDCRNCSVKRCFLGDLGAGGVRVGQTDLQQANAPGNLTSHIEIDNNIIRGGGRIWLGAIGVFVAHGGDNRITHNDIAEFGYTGVSLGWRWGYGKVPSVRNLVEDNRIHHLGGLLADMGGIYTLGEAPGTVLRGNLIHDIDGSGSSSMTGLYNDNSTTDMIMENNVVYNVRDGGYKFGSGRANVVRNNIFIAGRNGQTLFCIYYPERDKHLGVTLEKNIFYGSGDRLLAGSRKLQNFVAFKNNLYWEPSGKPLDFRGKDFQQWQASGRDAGSIVADPLFVAPENRDYRLKPGSPALKLGFKPFDLTQAGVYGSEAWKQEAARPCQPPDATQLIRPRTFIDDFERAPLGTAGKPLGAICFVENQGDAIEVVDDVACRSKRSLRITDAPGLKHGFNPHFYYWPGHVEGVTSMVFDLRVGKGARLSHQWREYPGTPYFHTGPSFDIANGALRVAGHELLKLPIDKWVHFELKSGNGKRATQTWDLTVTLPGQPPKAFLKMPTGSDKITKTTWLGFTCPGSEKTLVHLDNIHLDNSLEP